MSVSISTSSAPASPADAEGRLLKAGGLVSFSATDFPGKLAAVVFVQGCPWRCGYCHNPHLQPRAPQEALHWPRILTMLGRRIGLIDAVVFSGGEPTLDPALPQAIADARALGFEIGLHSAGIYPERLYKTLPMLDWIGLDVKAPFDHRYDRVTGVPGSWQAARASVKAVLASGIAHEFRTTVHPALLAEGDVLELARTLSELGVRNYALQVFRTQGCDDKELMDAPAWQPSAALLNELHALFPRFTLRQA